MSGRLPALMVPVRLRTAGASDRPAVARLIAGMDREGLYQRHFAHGDGPNTALLKRLEGADGRRGAVLVAEADDGRLVAHGEFVADDGGVEFALMVLPAWRGLGIARRLLDRLHRQAAAAGHRRMHGYVQSGNTAMLRIAQELGFTCEGSDDPAVMLVSRPLSPGREAWPSIPAISS